MSEPRKIVQEISGFYPLFEALLGFYKDEITPAVFGVAWRYCQMEDGVCRASLRTIAGILNISEATAMRRMETLCNDGYLIDTTPDARNIPHIYVDAGKVIMKSALGAVETVSHRNRSKSTVSHRNASVSQGNTTVSQSQLIKDSIKDSIKESDDEETKAIEARTQTIKGLYEQNIGAATPLLMSMFRNAAITFPAEWYQPAFEATVKSAKHRSWSFTEAVLQGWKDHGFGWKPGNLARSNGTKSAQPAPPADDNFMAELAADRAALRAEVRR